MNPLHNHLQKEATNLRLTPDEKSVMRTRLMQAIQPAPVRTYAPIKSPYTWFLTPRALGAFAMLLLVVISSGTAYAAEGSLPGGALYPVKTQVIEPLTVALASGSAAKAQVNANIAVARVQEAQTLAAHGQLTPAAAEEISNNYNAHATAALALAADVLGESDAATSTTVLAVTTSAPADSSVPPPAGTATLVAQDSPTLAATSTGDVEVVPASVHPTALTFSAQVTISTEAATTSDSDSGTSKNSEAISSSDSRRDSVAKSVVTLTSAATSSPSSDKGTSLLDKLHASLSVQAKILDKLTAEAHARHAKTPH